MYPDARTAGDKATEKQIAHIQRLIYWAAPSQRTREAPSADEHERRTLDWIAQHLGRSYETLADLTKGEASRIIDDIKNNNYE